MPGCSLRPLWMSTLHFSEKHFPERRNRVLAGSAECLLWTDCSAMPSAKSTRSAIFRRKPKHRCRKWLRTLSLLTASALDLSNGWIQPPRPKLWPSSLPCMSASATRRPGAIRSEEHTSELQSLRHLVCRLLLEKIQRTGTRHVGPAPPDFLPRLALPPAGQ